ncbi:ESPR-type extended signal peptide-containing protein [Megamonas hypermegale]|uniref:ESPR-type extended signal peptide-containing protein n=1 Tax=Megamonas hypermegale TaxID=158847 RepID=UPI0032085F18
MNKIYKVIWSKVKHQYVVVSELAHSNGKQSRTARKSLRSRIAALVVCGAIAAFGVFGVTEQQAFAATGGTATSSQYIAIAIDNTNNAYTGWGTNRRPAPTRQFGEYTYNRVNLDGTEYWVRDGYTAEIIHDKWYDGALTDNVIKVYKNDENVDDSGLLQSYQTQHSVGNITTHTGYNIQDASTGVYGGAVNTSQPTTPSNFGYNIDLNGSGKYATRICTGPSKEFPDQVNNFNRYFKEVRLENGVYKYKGEVVATNNVYVIDNKVGVFVNNSGQIYKGTVYGDNNEILMSAIGDDNNIYSYWSTKVNDPRATIGTMTVDQYDADREELKTDIKGVHGDDIKQINLNQSEKNKGTIAFQQYGQYNPETGLYEGDINVPGTITVESTGGTGGSGAKHDVKIKFSNTDEQGGEHSFTVDAGSKVEAVQGQNDKISAIKINGQQYNLGTGGTITGSFNTQTGEISVEQDGQSVLAGRVHDWKVTSANLDNNGTLTIGSTDTYNEANTDSVTVNNVASTGYVGTKISENNEVITKNYKDYFAANDNYVESGEVSSDGKKLTLTMRDDSTVDVDLEDFTSGLSGTDYRLVPNTTAGSEGIYKPDANGDIALTVKDLKTGTTETVTLSDVASAEKLSSVDNKVGNIDYSSNNYITDGDNLTVATGKLDTAIKDVDNNTITGGNIGTDGTVTLTQKDEGTVALTGKVQDWNVKSGSVDDNGTLTLNTENAYGGDTGEVTVNNVASTGYVGTKISENNEVITKNYKDYFAANDNYVESGEVSSDGKKLTLTMRDDSTVDVDLEDFTSGLSSTDYRLVPNTTAGSEGIYKPDANGDIALTVKDLKTGTTETVTLSDVASAEKLSSVDNKVGNIDYSSNNYITDGDSLTVAAGDLDTAIKATADKVDAGWKATAGETSIDVKPTEDGVVPTLNFAGDKNISVTADTTNKAIQVALNDKVYLGGDHTEDSRNIVLDGERGVIGLGSNIALDGRDGTAVIGGVNIDTVYDEATSKPSSTMTGLSNTTWDGETDDVSRAATEGQLKSVWDKANTAASSHTEVTVNGGTPAGNAPDYSDGNLQLSQKVDEETGKTTYDVKLNDNITLGDKESSSINLDGNNGSIALTNSKGETAVTINKDGIVVNNSRGNKGNGADVVSYDYDGDHGYMGSKVGINSLNEIGYNTQDVSYSYTKGKTTIGNVNITRVNDPTNAANADKEILSTAGNKLVIRAGGTVETKSDLVAEGLVQAGDVTVNADDSGLVEGLTNTAWTPEIADQVKADKADGTADGAATIAATQGQLGDVVSDLSDQITNSGWTASTNNGAVTTDITNGDKVDFANTDGNIAVNQTAVKDDKGNITGTNLTFDLKPDITLDDDVEDGNSVQLSGTNGTINAHNSELIFGGTGKYDNVNDMTFNQNGLTITNTQTMRDTGETTTSSTVINGGSIATGNITAGGITVNADNGGTVNGLTNKTWDADNYVSGQAATEDQLKSVSDKVNAGWIATDNNGNQITVNPKDNTLNFSGDRNVTVEANKEDGSIDVSLNDDIVLGGKDGSTSRVEIGGTNGTIMATKDANDMAATTTIDGGNVYVGSSISVGDKVEITDKDITGLSNTSWNGTTDDESRAATEGQLKDVSDTVNAGWTATDSNGASIVVNPENGSILNFAGDRNIDVKANKDNKSIDVSLSDDVVLGGKEGTSRVEIGGTNGTIMATKDPNSMAATTTIDGGNIYAGTSVSVGANDDVVITDKDITGLSNTTWDGSTNDISRAATEGQLKAVSDTVNAGWIATDSQNHEVNITPDNNKLNFAGDENVTVTAANNEIKVALDDDIVLGEYLNNGAGVLIGGSSGTISATNSITVGEDQGLIIDGQKKEIQGLSNTTWNEKIANDAAVEGSTAASTAATQGQLQEVSKVANAGWTASDGTNSISVKPNETLNFVGDENLTVSADGTDKELKVSLNDDITLGDGENAIKIDGTDGTLNIGSTFAVAEDGTVLSDGDVIADADGEKYSLSEVGKYAVRYDKTNDGTSTITLVDGDDLSGTRIKNVADGVDPKDAVNVSQLEAVEATANAGWTASDGTNSISIKPNETLNFVGDENLTVSADGTDKKLKVSLNDDITLGNPKAGNTEGERSFTINTTDPEGYVPDSYKEENSSGAEFIKENGGFMLFATDTQGHGIFGVTAKGSAWAKDFKTYTTDIYGNNTQYSLNEVGDAVAQMSSYYNEENGKSYTVFSRYLNEAEKDKPFETVDKNATRDIPLALRDDGAVLIGATIKGDDFTDNGIRINAEIDDDGNNVATITGLENTTWTPPAPVATFANEGTETSRAATEAQLNDLYGTVVGYNVDTNGVNYGTVTLGGGRTSYDQDTHEGGTVLNNVAYASGTDGSEAVNVDYLKDTINKAVEAGGSISNSDKHLVANTAEGSNGVYKPNAEGNVNLIVSDEKGNSSTVTIGDVASKTELDSLKTNVGDLNYDKVTGDKLVNGDSVTTAIGKLDNKIDNISGTATDAANNTVTGGTIKDDGTISLTQKDGGTVALDGKLTDSGVVQDGTKFDGETGTLTITSQDKYNKGTSSVTVSGIASKNDIGTVKDTIGATSKEDLKDAYKDADKDGNATTEYITDSETMVDADVALDHAVQDVANTSYANDMILSNRIDNVESRLGDVEERIDKVGAMAAAIANLRTMGYDPEAPTEVAVGVGQYKSETGIALGIFHYPNQDFMLSASISTSGDEVMGGIGATWRIGRKTAEEKAKDEEERILAKAEEIKQAAKRAEVKEQAERHAKLLAEREAKGEPIVPVEESAEQAQA